jgi:hypothetical protein
LIGHRAKLQHKIETRGGTVLRKGRVFRIDNTWRGRFTLVYIEPPRAGYAARVAVRHLDRNAFEVLP